MGRMDGKVAAIVGGATGFGLATAERMAAEGATVAILGRRAELAVEVDRLLQPDEAAKFAAAAWEVSSDGAGVTDSVLDLMRPYLDRATGS